METHDDRSESVIILGLNVLLKHYQTKCEFETRVPLLRPLFTVIFSMMQKMSLTPQTRNQSVDILYQVFQTDQLAFRKFAEPDTQTGQSWLTFAEKDIIGKIV